MLRIGIVGFGFMGRMHYRCWQQQPDARVVAICDTNPNIAENSREGLGNIEGAEEAVDFGSLEVYSDLAGMLQEQELDAVSITLPTYLHAESSVRALEAGVPVLCEKPMAISMTDCARMIAAAEGSGKRLQIGHCIRFWPEYAKAKEIVDSGEHGHVVAATFQRLAATAARKAGDWFTNEAQSGGMVLDLHIHDTDFVQHLFGMPNAVSSCAAPGPDNDPAHIVTRYRYDDDTLVVAEGGWAMAPSYGFAMRFHLVLEKATIDYSNTSQPTLRVCPMDGEVVVPALEAGDGYSLQVADFARRIRGESVKEVTSLEASRNSVRIADAERESAASGFEVPIA